MLLRSKLLIIITVFLGIQSIIVYGYFYTIFLPDVEAFEFSQADKNANRSKKALYNLVSELSNLGDEWSHQKILKSLVKNNQVPQIALLYTTERLKEENLHLFYLLDTDLKPIIQNTVDPNSFKEIPLIDLKKELDQWKSQDLSSEALVSGIHISERGPLILSLQPIVNEQKQKLGWLLLGRFITEDMIDTLAQSLQINIQVWPMGVKMLPDSIKHRIPAIIATPRGMHFEATSSSLNTYSYLSDLNGEPSFIVLSSLPRNTLALFKASVRHNYGVMMAVNLILILLLINFLKGTILEPLQKLTDFIYQVIANQDAPPRLKSNNKNEIDFLTEALNELIIQSTSYKNRKLGQAYEAGYARGKGEVLDEILAKIPKLILETEMLETRLWSYNFNDLSKMSAELEMNSFKHSSLELRQQLDRNNDYFICEITSQRKMIKRIKEKIFRISTLLKAHHHQTKLPGMRMRASGT